MVQHHPQQPAGHRAGAGNRPRACRHRRARGLDRRARLPAKPLAGFCSGREAVSISPMPPRPRSPEPCLGTHRLVSAALPPDSARWRALDPDAGPHAVSVPDSDRAGAFGVAAAASGDPSEPARAAPATLPHTGRAVPDRGRMVARRAPSQLLAQRDFPCPAKPCFNAAPSSEPRGLRAPALAPPGSAPTRFARPEPEDTCHGQSHERGQDYRRRTGERQPWPVWRPVRPDDARARTGARSGGGSGLALVLSGLALLISLVALALNLLPQQGGPAPGAPTRTLWQHSTPVLRPSKRHLHPR